MPYGDVAICGNTAAQLARLKWDSLATTSNLSVIDETLGSVRVRNVSADISARRINTFLQTYVPLKDAYLQMTFNPPLSVMLETLCKLGETYNTKRNNYSGREDPKFLAITKMNMIAKA